MRKTSAINIVSKEFFQVGLITYLILTLVETIKEGYVSNFFNLNYLLLFVLVSGVAMVLTESEGVDHVPTIDRKSPFSVIEPLKNKPALKGSIRVMRKYAPGQRRRTLDGF